MWISKRGEGGGHLGERVTLGRVLVRYVQFYLHIKGMDY